MLVRGLKGLSLHRPVKVERTRKRSEGFPPDRKVEKKKGEGPAVTVAAKVLQPKVAEVGRGAGCFCHITVLRPVAKSVWELRPRQCILSWPQNLPWRRSFRNCTARSSSPSRSIIR